VKIYLYNVNRNLNRVYRTCYSFGIEEIFIISDNKNYKLKGNLFTAKDKVQIKTISFPNNLKNIVAFENYYEKSIYNFDWKNIEGIIIGGETCGLPKKINCNNKLKIPTINSFCLTVEASLSIILYDWSIKQCS
jgi:tRNA(Leu) C34 or U34 (ribose-2'-O)-methylase TrmL